MSNAPDILRKVDLPAAPVLRLKVAQSLFLILNVSKPR